MHKGHATNNYLKVSDNYTFNKVTPVIQRSISEKTIKNNNQVELNIASATDKEKNNTISHKLTTVETAKPTTPPFRFETDNRQFGSVNTSSEDNTPFRIANTAKKTAPHRQVADFSPTTGNRLEEKTDKKYRHIGRISIKGLTEKFNQIIEEDSSENITTQTNNFVLQPIFNKGGNSNKFQMKAWTGEKGASKSLKKMDRPSKTPKEDSKRAAQIEAALRKCNLNILDRINSGNSVAENEEQMNNLFVANKDKANMNNTAEDMEDSELGLSSRIASPSPGQYKSKSLGKKPMFMEPNYKEE
ncbi:hypothetical protein G9A89_009496 [Geosiphon pyriformis]|nr:hypothetical protein G9A89_009496 [Geosiphon pyriformis]